MSYKFTKSVKNYCCFAPVIAALAWVIFNIQKPAREQFNRDFWERINIIC